MVADPVYQEELKALTDRYEFSAECLIDMSPENAGAILKAVLQKTNEPVVERKYDAPVIHRIHFLKKLRWVAAAVLLLLAGSSIWYLLKDDVQSLDRVSVYHNDIAPGKPGAKLKLSSGMVIELDSVKDGVIAMEAGIKVIKRGGEIFYEGKADAATEMVYNELIADKKQRSSATLPDGTIAWVNASSSVRYPVQFLGKERAVTMKGEAIFRVTHNAQQPFKVYVRNQVFEDLGTEFNINAYEDEADISTTVLEGVVQTGTTKIEGGQQLRINNSGKLKLLNQVDMDQVFAWRDGQFNYSSMDIEEIMRQVAKWYDVEVEFKSKINQQFTILGLSREKKLTEFLHALEQAGNVHFELNGRKLTVKP